MGNVITLPTEATEIGNKWECQKIGIIGAPGIGKSGILSRGEKTLVLQTEAGLNHIKCMKVVIRSWSDWEDVWTALVKSKQSGKFPYDTIGIDTIDNFVDFANDEAVSRGQSKYKSAEINTVGDIPNGAGWSWSTDLIKNAFEKLESLGVCVYYIGHLEYKEVKQPNNVSIHKQSISIGGKTGGFLVAWPDHLMNIESKLQGDKVIRRVRTIPTATMDAKSKGAVVPNGFELLSPESLTAESITKSDIENFQRIRSLFK